MLNQPFLDTLGRAESVLLIGAGGGYDIFGAVPLVAELLRADKRVHLAGVSFTALADLPNAAPHPQHQVLYPLTGAQATRDAYCPEPWLSAWLQQHWGYEQPIWAFRKTGVRPLRAALSHLVESLEVDALVLVDGGVDLVLRGDETSIGTPAEDLCSLAAAAQLQVPIRLVSCLGFGAELREGVRHAQVLQRVAELSRIGGYLGVAALLADTPPGDAYRKALDFTFANQASQRTSHVHTIVLAAMRGEFGAAGPDVWVSPLSSLLWFFDLTVVARSHLFLDHLLETETVFDVTSVVRGCRRNLEVKPPSDIPL